MHFEGTRDPHQLDLLLGGAVALQRVDRTADETVDDVVVETRGHDRETQVARKVIAFNRPDGGHGRAV
jgi:hypothetical protein